MHRTCLALFSTAALAAASAAHAAPETLRPGQTVQGELTDADAPRDDGGVSRDFRVEAKAGQFLVVSVRSDDFDGHVTVFAPDRTKVAENDDRVSGDYDPLAVAETAQDGLYTVRVGSLGGGESATGRFTLRVLAFSE